MERKFYLLSIIPNQQVRLELQSLRQRLFRDLGLASALAFEPVIPLAWCAERLDSAAFARFAGPASKSPVLTELPTSNKEPSRLTGQPRIEPGGLKMAGKTLFLEVEVAPEQVLDKLRAPLAEEGGQSSGLAGSCEPCGPAEILESSRLPEFSEHSELSAPFFPVTAGIFLAAHEVDSMAETAAALCADWAPALQSWTSSRIGLYSLSSGSDPWWQHVEWALEWKIQLKQV